MERGRSPVVELVRGNPTRTAILVADRGRASTSADVLRSLDAGCRVLAVDPTGIGEAAAGGFLLPLLEAAVGERPLGIQASQIAAVARWAKKQYKAPVMLVSAGRLFEHRGAGRRRNRPARHRRSPVTRLAGEPQGTDRKQRNLRPSPRIVLLWFAGRIRREATCRVGGAATGDVCLPVRTREEGNFRARRVGTIVGPAVNRPSSGSHLRMVRSSTIGQCLSRRRRVSPICDAGPRLAASRGFQTRSQRDVSSRVAHFGRVIATRST